MAVAIPGCIRASSSDPLFLSMLLSHRRDIVNLQPSDRRQVPVLGIDGAQLIREPTLCASKGLSPEAACVPLEVSSALPQDHQVN